MRSTIASPAKSNNIVNSSDNNTTYNTTKLILYRNAEI